MQIDMFWMDHNISQALGINDINSFEWSDSIDAWDKMMKENGKDWGLELERVNRLTLIAINSCLGVPFYMGAVKGVEFNFDGIGLGHAIGSDIEGIPTKSGYIKMYSPKDAVWTDNPAEMCSLEEILMMRLAAKVIEIDNFRWHHEEAEKGRLEWEGENIKILGRNRSKGEYGYWNKEYHGSLHFFPNSGWEVSSDELCKVQGWKREFIPLDKPFRGI